MTLARPAVAVRDRANPALDVTGGLLATTLMGWTIVSAALNGGWPWGQVELLAAAAVAWALAAAIARRSPPGVALLVVVGVMAAAAGWLWRGPGFGSNPGALGYGNAGAALFLQGVAAALAAAAASAGRWSRWSGVVAALAMAGVVVYSDSRAVDALLVLVVVAWFVRRPDSVRRFVVSVAVLVACAIGLSTALGAAGARGGPRSGAESLAVPLLSSNRLTLWRSALSLIERHPAVGVGPDRFQVASPIARSDPDLRWAHQEFLQQGAELGVPGLLLALALTGWAFLRLAAVKGPGPGVALAAAAAGALAIQGCVDYVWHFPAPVLAAAALGGAATAGGRARRPKAVAA